MFLRELTDRVISLKGVGSAISGTLSDAGILTVSDLLLHYPRGYEDRQARRSLAQAEPDAPVNTVVTVVDHVYFGHGRKATLKILVSDGTTDAALVCFGRNFLSRSLPPGEKFYLYGTFTFRFGELQATVFETEPYSERPRSFGTILPIYHLTGNLTQAFFRKIIRNVLDQHGESLDDELPPETMNRYDIIAKKDALRQIHFPSDINAVGPARRSLKFEELYFLQLTVMRKTHEAKQAKRSRRRINMKLANHLQARLPFELTGDQQKVLGEIGGDLAGDAPMTRLLQGDVGCGKTLVAILSSLLIVGSGEQAAVMAPTELLARQHAEAAAQMLEPLGITVALLSGTVKQEARRQLLKALKNGAIDIVFGTHALFSDDVAYKKLGLVVVDEQHRFGVIQRVALLEKGESGGSPPDLLLMTATPIPRSLALTVFGDLDVSTIRTMPPGRKPIETHLARMGNEKKVYDWVRDEIRRGHQAYFVYPLIQASEALDLKDAESMFDTLAADIFQGLKLGLIHSRLPEEDKRETMGRFQNGTLDILVATSVVEVGVNVANATCMVIEHAERFGLSALHQLRGRVGRASHQSYAFLVYGESITDDAKNRLKAMMNSGDGFEIAEQDLRIRGPGELTGVRQSGRFRLTIADIIDDFELLKEARAEVVKLLETDPGLLDPAHSRVRRVLERAAPFSGSLAAGG